MTKPHISHEHKFNPSISDCSMNHIYNTIPRFGDCRAIDCSNLTDADGNAGCSGSLVHLKLCEHECMQLTSCLPHHRCRNHGGSGGWRPPTLSYTLCERLIEIIVKCVIYIIRTLRARYSIKRVAK